MKPFFITSSGTDIGKTLVTSALCHQLKNGGKRVHAIKPVISGWENDEYQSKNGDTNDVSEILNSLELPFTKENIDKVSCYRFKAALSPDMAAKREGKAIDFNKVVEFCSSYLDYDYLFVEGVGGAMVPLTEKETTLDLIKKLNFPVIVVVGNYLGAISHALTTVESLKGVEISSVVISESNDPAVSLLEMKDTLKNFIKSPIITLPRVEEEKKKWKYAGDLLSAIV